MIKKRLESQELKTIHGGDVVAEVNVSQECLIIVGGAPGEVGIFVVIDILVSDTDPGSALFLADIDRENLTGKSCPFQG